MTSQKNHPVPYVHSRVFEAPEWMAARAAGMVGTVIAPEFPVSAIRCALDIVTFGKATVPAAFSTVCQSFLLVVLRHAAGAGGCGAGGGECISSTYLALCILLRVDQARGHILKMHNTYAAWS